MMNQAASFDDAFQILDRAMTAQPTPELGTLARSEYQFFKEVFIQETNASLAELSRGRNELMLLAREMSTMGADQSVAFATEAAKKLEEQLRESPALVIGGIAMAAFALGILASASVASASNAQKAKV